MHITEDVNTKFPELSAVLAVVEGLKRTPTEARMKELVAEAEDFIRNSYDLDKLPDNDRVAAYRKFMWSVGVDPTKIRPAGEALARRVLKHGSLPRVIPVVDLQNICSAKHLIPLSAYDKKTVAGSLSIRFAGKGEAFHGIGGKEMKLKGKEIVLADSQGILCLYPYRDTDRTKVTPKTKDLVVVGYGVPGIEPEHVKACVEDTIRLFEDECYAKLVALSSVD